MPKGIYKRKPFTKKHRDNMSKAQTGRKMSKDTIKRISDTMRSKAEEIYNYKGEEAGYRVKHHWANKYLGKPRKCTFCKKDNLTGHNIHWANISGEYKRIEEDWIRLCAKCHKNYDLNKKIC